MNSPDRGARVLVGSGSYSAGVEDNDFGLGRLGGAFEFVPSTTLDGRRKLAEQSECAEEQ